LEKLGKDVQFVVFGIVTELCVNRASRGLLERGRKVAIVEDAIETLEPAVGDRTLDELTAAGATLITTDEALGLI
jgi:nicotinamidase-related amidase